MNTKKVPFNKASVTATEEKYLLESLRSGSISGDGPFTKKCHAWFSSNTGVKKPFLTHSCTAALEMAAILANLAPGDEVIMPSFTFVSTANAVVLRGAVPVFVDIRMDTLNIDEKKIEEAITSKTKAIYVVHYAGVGCEMNEILKIAKKHNLLVVEDAAQGMNATYHGKPLGTIGQLGALSFHETKNIVSGEGGALFVNDARFEKRAEVIREKGTNRSQFFRGEVDKYTWVDVGSSYLPSDILAALLLAQLERSQEITSSRLKIWNHYLSQLKPLADKGLIRTPSIPSHCEHNAHIFYFLTKDLSVRTELLRHLKDDGISATFHYVPLHNAPAGQKYGRTHGNLNNTMVVSESMIRLPVWVGLDAQEQIINSVLEFFKKK